MNFILMIEPSVEPKTSNDAEIKLPK